MSPLANELDVRRVLHEQVSLAAVNQIYVIYEAMNGCKKSKDSLNACFEKVNIGKRRLASRQYPTLVLIL